TKDLQRQVTPGLAEYHAKTQELSDAKSDLSTLVHGWQGDEETAGHIQTLRQHVTAVQGELKAMTPDEQRPLKDALSNAHAIATHQTDARTFMVQLDQEQS